VLLKVDYVYTQAALFWTKEIHDDVSPS